MHSCQENCVEGRVVDSPETWKAGLDACTHFDSSTVPATSTGKDSAVSIPHEFFIHSYPRVESENACFQGNPGWLSLDALKEVEGGGDGRCVDFSSALAIPEATM